MSFTCCCNVDQGERCVIHGTDCLHYYFDDDVRLPLQDRIEVYAMIQLDPALEPRPACARTAGPWCLRQSRARGLAEQRLGRQCCSCNRLSETCKKILLQYCVNTSEPVSGKGTIAPILLHNYNLFS